LRARQKVRHHAKNIAANRLLTLTKRETQETGFSTPDDWQQYWAKFCRVYKKYYPDQPFMFVAVLEQHKGSDQAVQLNSGATVSASSSSRIIPASGSPCIQAKALRRLSSRTNSHSIGILSSEV